MNNYFVYTNWLLTTLGDADKETIHQVTALLIGLTAQTDRCCVRCIYINKTGTAHDVR